MPSCAAEASVRERVAAQIQIPRSTALFVLLAHLFVLLSALPLSWAVQRHAAFLQGVLHDVTWIHFGVGVYTAGIAFECAQNTQDQWYLSEIPKALCDCLFFAFMIGGFCLITMGCIDSPWVWAAAIGIALAHPVAYLAGSTVQFPLLGTSLFLVDGAYYAAVGEPLIVLHTLLTFAGLYFLALLMRTRAQWLHGAAATAFGLSMLVWPWSIGNAAAGAPASWSFVALISAALAVVLGGSWPVLCRAPATPRVDSELPAARHATTAA